MNNFTTGCTYDKARINVSEENVPTNALFKVLPDEVHVFEEREGKVSFYQVTCALEQGQINTLDKTIVCLVATFGSCCMTTRAINELLTLMGVEYTQTRLDSSINRLHRYQLINFSHFQKWGEEPIKTRIITLTSYGSQLAKSMGIVHRFNAIDTASMTAAVAKSRAQTTQLIVNFLKNITIDSFSVRPVIVRDVDAGAIVRPAAAIRLGEAYIEFEVPRRHEGWKEDLIDKLNRYKLVFPAESMPAIIINGEDEEMNFEVFQLLQENKFDHEVLYTDDLAMFGQNFQYSFYGFNESGEKICFEVFDQ